jgi:hypothetical protein
VPQSKLRRNIAVISVTWLVLWTTAAAGAAAGAPNQGPHVARHSPLIGVHVPWSVGGPRIEVDGSRVQHPGEWPSEQVRAIRLWDTRTAWLHLEPAKGRWSFDHLDAHLAKAREQGVEHITLVLWGTPRWAARDLDDGDAPWLGPGSAAPPRDQVAWLDYVTVVASRYQGLIDAYQIGNEPNFRMFWRGSTEELISMVVQAAERIKAIDPDATVIAPSMLMTTGKLPRSAAGIWQALARESEHIDAWSLHWYPTPATPLGDLRAAIAEAPKPLWLTEVGLPSKGQNPRQEQAAITRTLRIAQQAGVDYLAWYAWTDLGPPGLITLRHPGTLQRALGYDLA